MSVIAVKGIPLKWSLINVVKILAKAIKGNFEALNFQPGPKGKVIKFKICYLRLSEKLDPVRVVEQINSTVFPKQFRPFAYIPDHVPDIPLASKPKKMSFKMRRALKVPEENEPEQVIILANTEIMTELQSKYHGLHKISKKTNYQLLEAIARKIYERLKEISEQNPEVRDSCFKLTQWYRRVHPHFGDFQLVLSTLHALEDAAGTPRTQLQEKELDAAPSNPQMIDNLPFDKVQAACNTYTDRILKKVTDHVNSLKSQVTPTDTEDEIVRKKVREELKKMAPFLPLIVRQVLTKHFIPRRDLMSRVRIYGEPFLPNKDTMAPFVRRYHATRTMRSERMFNCLRFNIPQSHYASLMAMDGTVLRKHSQAEAGTSRPTPEQPQTATTTQQPAGGDQAVAKRALNETISARGENKRLRLDQSKRVASRSYAQATSAHLSVAITDANTGTLSQGVSDQVLAAIQKKIISEAWIPMQDTPGPSFNAKPLYTGGILKLWCCNDHTLAWLKQTVSELALPASTSLVVRSQSEIQKRVRCGIVIPDDQGVYEDAKKIGQALCYQNPWVDVKRWLLLHADKQKACWFVVLAIPEDQVQTLMRAERRLSIGLGSAYVKFQGLNGKFVDIPQGWDQATKQLQGVGGTLPPPNIPEVSAVDAAATVESASPVDAVPSWGRKLDDILLSPASGPGGDYLCDGESNGDEVIIGTDANAHHLLWRMDTQNTRDGAKLIIRSSDLALYKVSQASLAGLTSEEPQEEDVMDVEGEDWTDMM